MFDLLDREKASGETIVTCGSCDIVLPQSEATLCFGPGFAIFLCDSCVDLQDEDEGIRNALMPFPKGFTRYPEESHDEA